MERRKRYVILNAWQQLEKQREHKGSKFQKPFNLFSVFFFQKLKKKHELTPLNIRDNIYKSKIYSMYNRYAMRYQFFALKYPIDFQYYGFAINSINFVLVGKFN